MQSCSIHHCVLFFLTLTFTTVPTLASTSVRVKLHQSATLPCERNCSGLGKWVMSDDQSAILAQCNRTTCLSEKGYKMFSDKYRVGSLSLTIAAADYSKRNWYICKCDDKDVNQLRLVIETLMSSVQLNPGEALVMDLPVPEPVEVIYKPIDSAGLYGEQICTVTERSLQCKTEYTRRASLSYPNITLRDVNMSDSGSYTIRDRKNDEVIHIYTLIVKEVQAISDGNQARHVLVWLLSVLILVVGIIGAVYFLKIRPAKHLERMKQQELQLELSESLGYIKSLESLWQCLEENMHSHENETEDKWLRRAYSDTDLARILHKEDLKIFIEQYRARVIDLPEKKTLIRTIREGTADEFPRRSYSDTYVKPFKLRGNLKMFINQHKDEAVPLNENAEETESNKSQQGACSNADVVEVTMQMEEMNTLIKQDKNQQK